MKKILLFLISLTIGVVVFGIVTSKVGFNDIAQAFSLFSLRGFCVILFLTLIIALIDIWKLKFILKSQGYNISYWGVAQTWLPGVAISYLSPFAIWGGEFFMTYTLTKKYFLPWEKSGAAVFIFRAVDATIFFPFLILGVLIFPITAGYFPASKVLIAGGIITAIFVVLLINFYIKSFKGQSVLSGLLKIFGKDPEKVKEGKGGKLIFGGEQETLKFFKPRKKEMWIAIGNSLLKYSIILMRAWLLIFFFQGGLNVLKALAAYGFFNLADMSPIPAQLGIQEAAQALVFQGFGLGANVGVAFSLVLRAMDSLICLTGLLLLLKVGIELIKKRIMEIIDKFVSKEPEE
ncbi:MAG: lysylphosphatidylglycerol synthase transmembrane domain-containing protein [Candidatus Nealsonbacteria bacterium]|nr:lysylphosphatidylglycerol synthase transmembrane domain-containing protein [Candidatus Nealsonbacteria bacterium]